MNRILYKGALCLFLIMVVMQALASEGDVTLLPSEWQLIWNDEFENAEIDKTKWAFDLGNGFMNGDIWVSGWGNNELECYTNLPENVRVGNGKLIIAALVKKIDVQDYSCDYTSGRLKTKGLFSQTYGRFEAKIKLPVGKGLWPGFWMLPEDEIYGTWAASGEIDIMEAKGSTPYQISGAIHYGGQWPQNVYQDGVYKFPEDTSIVDFHVYAVEWRFGEIKWYVDGYCYLTQKEWYSQSPDNSERNPFPAPFDQPFYILLNLAVGGNYDGAPDENTKFPQIMEIDYVRVYTMNP